MSSHTLSTGSSRGMSTGSTALSAPWAFPVSPEPLAPPGPSSAPSPSSSSMRLESSASLTSVCSSIVESCSSRMACWSRGVMARCWPSLSCRVCFIRRTRVAAFGDSSVWLWMCVAGRLAGTSEAAALKSTAAIVAAPGVGGRGRSGAGWRGAVRRGGRVTGVWRRGGCRSRRWRRQSLKSCPRYTSRTCSSRSTPRPGRPRR